jgi:thiamine biosynthesis lipoprotein
MAVLSGCSQQAQQPIQKLAGEAQGTTYQISYWSPLETSIDPAQVEAAVNETFASIDKDLSNYRPDSVIEQFNANPTTTSQTVTPDIIALVQLAKTVQQFSQGCFDLTIKPLFDLWGFRGESLTLPTQEALDKALQSVGMDKLDVVDDSHLAKKMATVRVDLSAVAQGFTVGKMAARLEGLGVNNYLVEIGGELKSNGRKPDGKVWRVALEKPLPGERKIYKVVNLPKDRPMSVMASGTYRHYFDTNGQRYSHILDARTGRPVTHDTVSVTVFHENPTVADAWSTALLCLGQTDGLRLANEQNISAMFIRQRSGEMLETRSDALKTTPQLAIQ